MDKNSVVSTRMGNKLKELRKSKNITQEKLAELTGISRATIANYEKGYRKISPENGQLIKDVLKIENIFDNDEKQLQELLISLTSLKVKNGLSSTDLSSKLGVSRSTLSRIENGTRKPSKKVIERINELLSESHDTIIHKLSIEKDKTIFPQIDKDEMGERIHQIRVNREESLANFGKQFTQSVGKNVVSRWEKGINIPDIERLMNIANLGETTVPYLLYGDFYRNMLQKGKDIKTFEKLDPIALGKRLRKIRKEKQLEREEFGKQFDPPIRKWSMDRYENGKDIPNTERLIQYGYLGDVSISFLIYGSKK